jgi:hypothetical protein
MSFGKPARARRSSWMFAGAFRNSSSGFISRGGPNKFSEQLYRLMQPARGSD